MPLGIILKERRDRLALRIELVPDLSNVHSGLRIFPSAFEPLSQWFGRRRTGNQLGPAHFEDKIVTRSGRGGPLGRRWIIGKLRMPDGRVLRQIPKPQMPELIIELAAGRIAVLVQRFQIAEDLRHALPSDLQTVFASPHPS
ncbi:MAG TPA: hypothetical protein VJN43_09920 [Bryobacteraceae bacterium]|nr:hypothetical protein [Bryobacteraceae bacterium]